MYTRALYFITLTRMIKPGIIFIALLFTMCLSNAPQLQLPEAVTNHSAVILQKEKENFIYTFYGLDSSKKWSGVHTKIFRVDLQTGLSKQIGTVPDSLGRLASSASVIRNKAFIAGGYAVFENGKEQSSKHLFIFEPLTEIITRGADLPIAIDDHIQSVWRDSLFYVISGWSDSNNVRNVQVYDPSTNKWQLATALPEEKTAAVFGGSGIIVGDIIYVLGGAQFEKFYPPSRQFYKGFINPRDPLQITWVNAGTYPGSFRYRSAAFSKGGKIYFWGGSNETYNYNGIAYLDKKPVEPNKSVLIYHIKKGGFSIAPVSAPVMDLRNIVCTADNRFYVTGGMSSRQQVVKNVWLIKIK